MKKIMLLCLALILVSGNIGTNRTFANEIAGTILADEINGTISDVNDDHILFIDPDGTWQIKDRASGQLTSLMPGNSYQQGYLTPKGAIIQDGDALTEWRDGTPINLGSINSALSLVVRGQYAIFNVDQTLYLRDLETGTNTVVSTSAGNIQNDVTANGRVVYWGMDFRIYSFLNGVTTPITNDNALWNVYPTADDEGIVYRKQPPCCADAESYQLMYHHLDSATDTVLGTTYQDNMHPYDYVTNSGWVAFNLYNPDHKHQEQFQLWLRNPNNEIVKVSDLVRPSSIISLSPIGDVVFADTQVHLYQSSSNTVSTFDLAGDIKAFWLGNELYFAEGGKLMKVASNNNVDTTPPITVSTAPTGWSTTDVTVALSATDSESGVQATFYKLDEGPAQSGNEVLLTTEGVHAIAYWSIDNTGNEEVPQMITVKIDKSAPVSFSLLNPGSPNGNNGWYTSKVKLNLSADDNLSGLNRIEIQAKNGEWQPYNAPLPPFGEGVHSINYRSVDQAGNIETVKTENFKVDTTKPQLNVKLDKSEIWPPNNKIVKVHAKLTYSDATSGVKSVVLTSITSNKTEHDHHGHDKPKDKDKGHPSDDDDIIANFGTEATSFSLRAVKDRVYTVTYTITDNAGNVSTAVKTVRVEK